MKDKLLFIVKVAISIALILYLFRRMDSGDVWQTIRTANVPLLFLAFALYVGAIVASCGKWYVLLRAQRIWVPYSKLVAYYFVALFFGNLLPTNVGGDIVRAYDLSRYTDRPAEASLSVLVDRLVGMLVFIGSASALSFLVLILRHDDPTVREIALLSALVFAAGLLCFLAVLSRRISSRGRFIFRILPQLKPLQVTAKRIYEALQHYRRSYRALILAGCIAFSVQMITTLVNFIVALALGLDIPFFYFFVFNPLIAFVLLVPISVNGIGLQQTAYVFFYSTLAGVASEEKIFSMSVTFHALIILSSLLGGLFWLQRRNLKPAPLEAPIEGPVS